MINGFAGNTAITTLIGKDDNGNPAIFGDRARVNGQFTPFPHLTVSRFSSAKPLAIFDEQPDTAGRFDCPRIAVAAWDQESKDRAYQVYRLAEQMLLGTSQMPFTNQYFSGYKIVRTVFRDDLFDDRAQAYHIHGEFSMWAQLTDTQQPY
jgi:hypothetical protein